MDEEEPFRYDSDSGSDLSESSHDSFIRYQRDVMEEDEVRDDVRSSGEGRTCENERTASDVDDDRDQRTAVRGGRERGHGRFDQFEWDFYPEEDPFEQNWLKEFEEDEGVSGELLEVSEGEKPVEFFKLFFPDETVDSIVRETNR